jgi:hypothetical protein
MLERHLSRIGQSGALIRAYGYDLWATKVLSFNHILESRFQIQIFRIERIALGYDLITPKEYCKMKQRNAVGSINCDLFIIEIVEKKPKMVFFDPVAPVNFKWNQLCWVYLEM